MQKKAQASSEYILVSALILLIILPTIYIFYSYSHKSSEEIRQSQVNKIGTDIVDSAKQIYYLGGPSKTTLDAIMPEGIEKIEIWHNQELVFFLNDGTELAFKSRVNITTDNLCTEQTERCNYNFKNTVYSSGLKHITIEAKGDYVLIGEANLTEVCNGIDDDYDGLVDEDFTNENCQPKCEYNGYTWTGRGNSLNCCGNDANEDSPYQLNEKVPADYCADGNDNDCDGLIDALDPDCFECTPSSTRLCSEQGGVCTGSFETCTAEGTWPGCSASNYGTDYEDPETSCGDSLDNDCDGLIDALDPDCFECTPSSTRLCSKQDGVCAGSFETCTAEGTWPGCDYLTWNSSYETIETICDSLDNDCDNTTDEEEGMANPLNLKQEGVCSGSTQSCIAGIWQDYYGEIANYEGPETSCSDSLDNDCNTESDYDSQDGLHGDTNCKVAATAIAVSNSNPIENTIIEVSCTSSVAGVNSIKASIEGITCPWKSWSGNIANFDCNVGGAGTKTVLCSVDTTKSYPYGVDQTTTITVRPSECSAYTYSSNCEADTRCDWCPECSGTEYSGDVSRCVSTGTCSYYCWKGECSALCDETQGSTTQDYYKQSGVESSTGTEECDLRDYYCTADCGETYTDIFKYSCGICKYISVSSCTGTTLGSCTNYAAGTSCGTNLACDGNGNCLSTCVCSSGACCDGCYYKASGAQPTGYTDDTNGFCTGTNGATSTSYAYTRNYYCNGVDVNMHYTDTIRDTCGTCEYCTDNDLTCNYYSSSTTCSALQDCDYLNNYHITGTQSATSTSYCKYENYNDNYKYCNGAGSCSSLTCSLGSDTTTETAGICQYIGGCSDSTPGTVNNYADGTSCGTNLACDGNGNCLSTCVCSSGACCDGCYYKASGAQPTGYTDDTNGFCTGTNGATSTSYAYTRNYYCNGVDSNMHYTDTIRDTCGTCEYCTDNDLTCNYYSSSTTCSALQDCDYLNNYHITGTQSAASTSYCKYANYNDYYRYCNGAGSCSSLTCPLGSDTTTATAGICQYIGGCSGSTSGTVNNYAAGTSCGTNQICIFTYGPECIYI